MVEILDIGPASDSDIERKALLSEGTLGISLDSEVARNIRNVILMPNPNLDEIPFLCFVSNNNIDSLLVPVSFSEPVAGEFAYTRTVNKDQLRNLFMEMAKKSYRSRSLVLGHLHPTGKAVIGGVSYIVEPDDLLLNPSTGSVKEGLTSAGDLAFYKRFDELNPSVRFDYVAIAGNTALGPKLRVYSVEALLRVKKFKDLDYAPSSTFDL